MPFITEEIWQALPHEAGNDVMILRLQKWPEYREDAAPSPAEEKAMEAADGRHVRRPRPPLRDERAALPEGPAHHRHPGPRRSMPADMPFLKRLAYASDVTVTGPDGLGSDKEEAAKGVVTVVTHVARIGMPLAELVDLEKEKARIAKALKKNQGELDKLNNKLGNPGFLAKAPENVVKTEQERAEKLAALIAQLEQQAASL